MRGSVREWRVAYVGTAASAVQPSAARRRQRPTARGAEAFKPASEESFSPQKMLVIPSAAREPWFPRHQIKLRYPKEPPAQPWKSGASAPRKASAELIRGFNPRNTSRYTSLNPNQKRGRHDQAHTSHPSAALNRSLGSRP